MPANQEKTVLKQPGVDTAPANQEKTVLKQLRVDTVPANQEKTVLKRLRVDTCSASQPGKDSLKTARSGYRASQPGKAARAAFERRRHRGNQMFEGEEVRAEEVSLSEDEGVTVDCDNTSDSDSEETYSKGRLAAFETIRTHKIKNTHIFMFHKIKANIEKSHKTVFLPNLPLLSGSRNSWASDKWNHSAVFARSKSILKWSTSAKRIFEKQLQKDVVYEMLHS